MAQTESTKPSDAARVTGWIEALVRAIDACRSAPPADPAVDKALVDLEGITRSCLEQIGDFAIRVEAFDLFYENECIFHNTKAQENSLTGSIFESGVRGIAIRWGVEPHELRALVEALERATRGPHQDSEDVVTFLWEQSFEHISYACAPWEEWNPEGVGDAPTDSDIPWPPAGDQPDSDADASAEKRSDDWSLDPETEAAAPTPPSVDPARYAFTTVEAQNVLMLARLDEVDTPWDRVAGILIAALEAEEKPSEFFEIASSIGRLIEHALAEGNLSGASDLLERLRRVSDSRTTATREFQSAANRVLDRMGRAEILGRLGIHVGGRRSLDLAALTKFLAQLGPAAAPTLCDLLGDIEEMKVRRAICEALVISCRERVGILLDRLSDPRWFVVRNILYVLGRIAHQGIERALGDALTHKDVRVRKEAVRSLGGIDSPASRAYLNSALRDTDKEVRLLVASELARRKDEPAARILWTVIESPEFAGRDLDERVAFCGALSRAGADALVPQMERMLTRGGSFQAADQPGRLEGAMALAWLGTPAALAILNREAKSRNEAVRRAVTGALETVRRQPTTAGTSPGAPPSREDTSR